MKKRCKECKKVRRHVGRGKCPTCYSRWYRTIPKGKKQQRNYHENLRKSGYYRTKEMRDRKRKYYREHPEFREKHREYHRQYMKNYIRKDRSHRRKYRESTWTSQFITKLNNKHKVGKVMRK